MALLARGDARGERGGQRKVDHVVSRLELFLKILHERKRIDQRGRRHGALAHPLIKVGRIELFARGVHHINFLVHAAVHGDDGDAVFFDDRLRKIDGSLR